jgi:hypothetical protein
MASDLDTRSPPHLSIGWIVSAGTRNAISGSFLLQDAVLLVAQLDATRLDKTRKPLNRLYAEGNR